ncbi:serine/threonine-protein kinase ypk2/ykr2 [Anaeramoeba flamelloides]|uniref:non-specific serine/threonine protein kinase n=1 Tax=Anaeramoeba flamelloides TaxID=1746091 RepID=A0AAV7YSM7_9EUKA|nr:serine/threonine-protein kinase ypk2/ykr2 [Anaeramoeba flamelloides]KAJ6246982.1 serine/threonine-protein kinase ypk2/ykr2 [Anaeramoeba flamelloides]|eukprot:Anaeramoba_flamelloidesa566963_157.p1 GENE.a566963_157~~a566963_157.p1  ORF type:complete len:443 (-),score=90.66 a566963_157:69-1397(-)
MSEIIKSGYLVKQGGRIKTWKKRWFVIKDKTVYYYKKENSRLPLGMFALTKSVTLDYAKKRRKKNVFSCDVPSQRTYYISAGSEQLREEWIKSINNEINSLKTDKVSMKDFKLLSVIGRGTYGKVMQVKKKDTSEIYAMKTLQKGMLADHQQISQTMSERNVLMRVRHPFLIGLQYSFQTPEKLYMVLDYAPGGELFHHLRDEGRFAESRACLYTAEIVLGLEHLHKMDIIYRDLKPENLLLDKTGHIRITDFGLVKMDLNKKHGGKTNTFCGTPEYLAPEILLDEGYTLAVDWWALGILIYEMLVGVPPFYAEEQNDVYKMILKAKLKIPFYIRDDAKDLITKLLDRDPKARLGTKGAEEIKKHPFFSGLDWEKVYNKEYTPEFLPKISDLTDVRNFDEEFTDEKVVDSLVTVSAIGKVNESDFKGFTYIGEIEGIGTVKK